jgi:cbb3-type cytochrome oxidase maturation protein
MISLYIVLPLAILIAGAAVAAFVWTVRSGQLDDVDSPPRRVLFDDPLVLRAPRDRDVEPGAVLPGVEVDRPTVE